MSTHPFQNVQKALEKWKKKAAKLRYKDNCSKLADVMYITVKICVGTAGALNRTLMLHRESGDTDAADEILEDLNDMAHHLEEGLR